jgi:hypothetical protein
MKGKIEGSCRNRSKDFAGSPAKLLWRSNEVREAGPREGKRPTLVQYLGVKRFDSATGLAKKRQEAAGP